MVYIILAAMIFGLDIFLKNRIEAKESSAFPIELDNGMRLEKHHNKGFMLNKLDDRPRLVRLVSVLTMVPLLFWFIWLLIKKAGGLGKTGAAFLVGGAASNVYDRLTRGYVVDYLRLPAMKSHAAPAKRFRSTGISLWNKKIRHIIFNIADFFIFIGAGLSAIYCLFSSK